MTPKKMTIDEIFIRLKQYGGAKLPEDFDGTLNPEEAKAAIKALVLEMVPEEKHVPNGMESTGRYDAEIYWNECRAKMIQNIEERFK